MTARHGLGHKRDRHDERDWKLAGSDLLRPEYRAAAAPPLPDFADLTRHIDKIRDQGRTGSCVGQAIARAIHIRAGIEKLKIDFPSALQIYAAARQLEAGRADTALEDVGCFPRYAAKAIAKPDATEPTRKVAPGVVSEKRWPFDETKVNQRIPWDVVQAGADAMITGYYRITGSGPARVELVKRALASGVPVAFGMIVDDAYSDYRGGVWDGTRSGHRGGHMQCLVGYAPGEFTVINSWGESWGAGGMARLSERFLAGNAGGRGEDQVFDLLAYSIAPRGLS